MPEPCRPTSITTFFRPFRGLYGFTPGSTRFFSSSTITCRISFARFRPAASSVRFTRFRTFSRILPTSATFTSDPISARHTSPSTSLKVFSSTCSAIASFPSADVSFVPSSDNTIFQSVLFC